jgi:hypothetical protein
MGLACLARYNGVFLFPLVAGAVLARERTLRLPWQFFAGGAIGAFFFTAWLYRNFLAFGSPFYSEYRDQLSPDYLSVIGGNVLFYLNPLHNVLPVLFICLLYGLWRHARGRSFPLWTAAAASALTMIWTTTSMRFVFPAFPILLGFAAWGAIDLITHLPSRWRGIAVSLGAALLLVTHLGMLCIYTVSICHVAFDRHIGLLPQEIPLTIEPRYSSAEAKFYINRTAPTGAQVLTVDAVETISYERGVFRDDLVVSHEFGQGCPVEQPVFVSQNSPRHAVERLECNPSVP